MARPKGINIRHANYRLWKITQPKLTMLSEVLSIPITKLIDDWADKEIESNGLQEYLKNYTKESEEKADSVK